MDRKYILSLSNTKKFKKGRKATSLDGAKIQISCQHSGHGRKGEDAYQVKVWLNDEVNHFSKMDRWDVAYLKDAKRLYIFYECEEKSSGYKVFALKNGYHTITFTNSDFVSDVFKNEPSYIKPELKYDEEANMYYADLQEETK